MKKIFLILILSIITFAGTNKVTLIKKEIKKDNLIFIYDTPTKNFNDLKQNPNFYKKILTNILCKKNDTKMLINIYNVTYDYRNHQNKNEKVVIKIKKGTCRYIK